MLRGSAHPGCQSPSGWHYMFGLEHLYKPLFATIASWWTFFFMAFQRKRWAPKLGYKCSALIIWKLYVIFRNRQDNSVWSLKFWICQWDFQGPPILGPLTHTIPIRIPKDMGIVWVPLTIRGSHCWESLESPLTPHLWAVGLGNPCFWCARPNVGFVFFAKTRDAQKPEKSRVSWLRYDLQTWVLFLLSCHRGMHGYHGMLHVFAVTVWCFITQMLHVWMIYLH